MINPNVKKQYEYAIIVSILNDINMFNNINNNMNQINNININKAKLSKLNNNIIK